MADNIVLKTYKGGTVTPQNDAIVQETAIPANGIFKGCNISYARGNILRVSSGFGMIKGRFFEIYESEVDVQLADAGVTLQGRLYVHMDLSNADEPIQLLTQTVDSLPELVTDSDVNYNNSVYDLELATFRVTSSEISRLEMTFQKISNSSGDAGGKENVLRSTKYQLEDMTRCMTAPGWVTLVCIQGGETAPTIPSGYAAISKTGDEVVDGTAVFQARNIIGELTELQNDMEKVDKKVDENMSELSKSINDMAEEVANQLSSTGNLIQKLMLLSDYEKLNTYDDNTMYYCYDSEDTHEIKRIYLGEHIMYATGIQVTYKIDTGSTITQVSSLSSDVVAAAPPATKKDYTFAGWRTDNLPESEVLTKYVLNNENAVTLYAVFKKAATIIMDPLDAEEPEDLEKWSAKTTLYYNNGNSLTDQIVMPECPYTKEDKSFCGWKIDSASQIGEYVNGESYQLPGEVILFPTFVDTEYDYLEVANTYRLFKVPATGIYEMELWGGAGGDASGSVTINGTAQTLSAKGGKGGHVKGYKKLAKDTLLYVYNGGKANGTAPGYNGGQSGYSYSSSKHMGAGSGGATYIATQTFPLGNTSSGGQSTNYKNRNQIIILAAGGGGAGISASTSTSNSNPLNNYQVGAHNGGAGGGEKGEDGSSGNLGGRQSAVGIYEYSNFGYASQPSVGSTTYSCGGAGWFGGNYGLYGNSGAGGSSYVGNVPTFVENGVRYKNLNEAGVNEGNGYCYIRYVCPCKM